MKSFYLSIFLCLLYFGSTMGFTWAQPFDAISDTFVELGEIPLTGIIPVGQYDYDENGNYYSLDTVLINLASSKRYSSFAGGDVWLHPAGAIIFSLACEEAEGNVYMLWERGEGPRAITPCSSDLHMDGYFDLAKLSPDKSKIALEHYYYDEDDAVHYEVVVFDVEQHLLVTFENHTSPAWLPDGRLIVGGAGIYSSNEELSELDTIILLNREGNIYEGANNIAIDPSGTRLVFEYNHAIWHMQVDGSDFFELISNTTPEMQLWFPTWSPDGRMVAYMARPEAEHGIYANIFFHDVETGEGYSLNILPLLDAQGFVSGPLSWR